MLIGAIAACIGISAKGRTGGGTDVADEGLAAHAMQFPRDHGSHPDFRTEWWYATGHATVEGRLFGFQITFFRSRIESAQPLASKFAAKQLLFAHAAVTDVKGGKLLHDQRIARVGFGVAEAATGDAAIRLRDWSLLHAGDRWIAKVSADDFALDLAFEPTQGVLLQGKGGLSRKGPAPENVSHYYSLPQLAVSGSLSVGGRSYVLPEPARENVAPAVVPVIAPANAAWLDREWSDSILHPDAVGWDWIGMNLADGGALMAFRIRDRAGNTFWDGGSYRSASGQVRVFERFDTGWQPLRRWSSAASGAVYPVEWRLNTPIGAFTINALVDNQELDSRASTGSIYWEGLCDLLGEGGGKRVGRGYLEMTGYAAALRLS
ncbi:MAG: lipocalin-like domain-containing protein [Burkholderiales bacterium]